MITKYTMQQARFFLWVLLLVATATVATTVATETKDLQANVRSLTRQLAADRLADRDRAEKELLALGPAVLDVLPDGQARLPAEANRRLTRIRRQLEERKARESVEGRRVSLQALAQPLSTLIAQLESLSGNRIVDYRALRRQPQTEIPISVDVKNVTFWEALDRVLGEADMEIYPYAIDTGRRPLQGIAFIARDPTRRLSAGPIDYEGGFRFEAIRIRAERDYRNVDANGLAVHVQTLWEPRLNPIHLVLLRNTVTAVDKKGRLFIRKGNGESEIAIDRTAPVFILPFGLSSDESQWIQTLSGELQCLLPSERETFHFENLSEGGVQRLQKARAVVTLQSVHAGKEEWVIAISVRLEDAEKALESHRTGWMQRNAVYLEDATGARVAPLQIEQTAEGKNVFGFAFHFKPPKKIDDYALIYTIPTTFITRRIPFRLEGLKLP